MTSSAGLRWNRDATIYGLRDKKQKGGDVLLFLLSACVCS